MLHTSYRRQRKGIVLLIVITMLTLFSIVGLSFVFYAESEGVASQLMSDTFNQTLPDADPESLLSFFLREFTYDTANTGSAIRGHGLSRTMYGSNPLGANASPYSGIGRLHTPAYVPPALGGTDPLALAGFDDYFLPNYTFFTADGFIRDPEYYYANKAGNLISYRATAQLPGSYRASNASYTYPDMNNMFLARVDADGSVIAPSFHRDYLAPNPVLAPPNKYSVLFPSTTYHNGVDNNGNTLLTNSGAPLGPFTVPDADARGHVRNLDYSRGTKISTSIAIASNLNALPPAGPGIINVLSTSGFPLNGTIAICMAGSLTFVQYTGISATGTAFTGCTVISAPPVPGTLATAQLVVPVSVFTNIAAASNNQALPTSTIFVNSVAGFAPSGVISVNVNGTLASITYTAIQANPPAFLGCSGGSGTLSAVPAPGNWVLAPTFANNDSYWMDLGWPVMTARNGKKFKPLFAPLVLDLDSRINLMVSGNMRNQGLINPNQGVSVSNKGYGPTEINLNWGGVPVSLGGSGIVNALDMPWLFSQRNVVPPGPPFPAQWLPPLYPPRQWPLRDGPPYAAIDFDGLNGGPLTLPNPYNANYTSTPLFYAFPDYPQALPYPAPASSTLTWYGSGFPANGFPGPLELFQHPLSYNYLADTRSMVRASNLEAMLRLKGMSGPGATSPFFKNMPNTLSVDRVRNMLTMLSANLDRITTAPYLQYNPSQQTTIVAPNPTPLPQATINVASTSGFPQQGQIGIIIGNTVTYVSYTGINATGTAFTGCTGGAGVLAVGQTVTTANYLTGATAPPYSPSLVNYSAPATGYSLASPSPNFAAPPVFGSEFGTLALAPAAGPSLVSTGYYPYGLSQTTIGMPFVATTIAANSNNKLLPQATIFVASTSGLPRSGTVAINMGGGTLTFVSYTGITPAGMTPNSNMTTTTFALTGCTGGTGQLLTGQAVTPYLGSRLRLNLNRIAGGQYDYPTPDATGFIDLTQTATLNQFTTAQTVRQQLAYDIYYLLVSVTGALDPNQLQNNPNNVTMKTAAPQQFQAAQWLAQLAVNIVDYIDNDDISTPFVWYNDPTGANPSETVFGTELPRLVLNEVYAQLDNDPNDQGLAIPKATTSYNLNVWAELHNPSKNALVTTIAAGSNGQALPQATINVASTVGFPSSGVLVISIGGTPTLVAYTGTKANSFTGCAGGTGNLATGQSVVPLVLSTTVAAASNGQNLPFAVPGTGVINVASTVGFPTAGTITITIGGAPTIVSYTATTATQFVGCSGGSGVLATGQTVATEQYPLDAGLARLNVGNPVAATTIAAGSNAQVLTYPGAGATIFVGSTAGFQSSGMITITVGATSAVVAYTGTTGTTFTGCTLTPAPTTATLATGQAVAQYNSAYQIVLETPLDAAMRNQLGQNRGDPGNPNTVPSIWNTANATTGSVTVMPANGAFNNDGFYVVGPSPPFAPAGRDPQLQPLYRSGQMTATGVALATDPTTIGATVLLRRLACPYLLPDPNPNSLTYNPYITVDYVELQNNANAVAPTPTTMIMDSRLANPAGALTPKAFANMWSVGRKQPYAALSSLLVQQSPYATIAVASNGQTLPQPVINVLSTLGFPPAGTISITIGGVAQVINYTGTTATTFTGCTGGAGMLATGLQVTPAGPQPQNTFLRHNSANNFQPQTGDLTLTIPFDWLVQLDRPVVNSMELAYVSGYRPHELTQQFINATGKFQHVAPWAPSAFNPTITAATVESTLIYRALEVLGVPSYLNGTMRGGRVPGKININTMNEVEIWRALADQVNNFSSFQATDVDLIYRRLMLSRTASGIGGAPGLTDRPFKSLATLPIQQGDLQYPLGTSPLSDTVLRQGLSDPSQATNPPTNVPLFTYATQPTHAYQQNELLQKITNNLTTNSNVFAIWLTVGFFEVQDVDSAGNAIVPPKIGSEIGRNQGQQIRHRMFAIVDRTGLNLAQAVAPNGITSGNQTVQVNVNPVNQLPAPNGGAPVPAILNTMVGNQVEIGPDPITGQSEVVTVTAVTCASNSFGVSAGTITANFKNTYSVNTPIMFRGNPGPQPRSMSSLVTIPVASGGNTVQVAGTVSNIMLGDAITIGPDPNTGATEQRIVSLIDTSNPATPAIRVQGAFVNNYSAASPVTWTSAVPYQARNDPGVVLHLSVVK
jgi:hypothetical protein